MAKKKSYITVTDQFCGAGGSSQGVRNVSKKMGGGLKVQQALNHWKLAIETHQTNFPDTDHDCTDISACDPRRYHSTDILITSPECTTHSPAGGNNHKALKKQMDLFNCGKIDPATERSRATMWDVCRFAEYHQYHIIIVENVVEARTRWALFDAWLNAMHVLGYKHKSVFLNSQHCWPTPQSRDRMYIVFWKKGNPEPDLDLKPLAHCPQCGKDVHSVQTWKNPQRKYGKYRQQYTYRCPVHGIQVEPYYYASFNCIDWSDRGIRIGDRKKSLKPRTTERIKYGINKYKDSPFIFQAGFGEEARGIVRDIASPFFSQVTSATQAIINPPMIINDQHTTGIDFRVRSVKDVFQTMATQQSMKLVIPPPFIIKAEHTASGPMVRSTADAMQTQVTRQTMSIVIPPAFLTECHNNGKARLLSDVFNTVTAGAAKNGIVTTDAMHAFIANYYGGSHTTNHFTDAIGTITCKDSAALVTYNTPEIEDCYYRMVKDNEVKLAMAFDKDYIILGTSKDRVKQCGNAVTPPAMEFLVEQCIKTLN